MGRTWVCTVGAALGVFLWQHWSEDAVWAVWVPCFVVGFWLLVFSVPVLLVLQWVGALPGRVRVGEKEVSSAGVVEMDGDVEKRDGAVAALAEEVGMLVTDMLFDEEGELKFSTA